MADRYGRLCMTNASIDAGPNRRQRRRPIASIAWPFIPFAPLTLTAFLSLSIASEMRKAHAINAHSHARVHSRAAPLRAYKRAYACAQPPFRARNGRAIKYTRCVYHFGFMFTFMVTTVPRIPIRRPFSPFRSACPIFSFLPLQSREPFHSAKMTGG